jgi:hypothetical protein
MPGPAGLPAHPWLEQSLITAGPVASAACKAAVDRANAMLASALKLRRALAEQDRILRDPATQRLSGPEVVQKLTPALQAGSGESTRFDRALAHYRQVVDRCELQAP